MLPEQLRQLAQLLPFSRPDPRVRGLATPVRGWGGGRSAVSCSSCPINGPPVVNGRGGGA